ncbi:MAG TPA: ABC transporter substrate-binding protein [Actinomycetota bacterium]|nr:ABC transporter substrate-binding protein [Actinomycetota bacterium]
MTTMRRAAGAVLALLLFVPAACRDTPDAEASSENGGGTTEVTLAVGGQVALPVLPSILANELGFYEDEGIELKIEDFEGGSEALQSLLGGSADVVSGFYDHTIQMAAQNRSLQAFVTMQQYPGLVLAASPAKDDVTSLEDLDGGVVGVSAPGSSTDLFLKYLLAQNGMEPDAASVVAIGTTSTAVAAMEKGKVDAAVMVEPAVSVLEQRAGGLDILADTRTAEGVEEVFGTAMYPGAVLYTTSEWLENNRETVGKLARAVARALEWISTHSPEEVMEAMPESFQGGDPEGYLQGITKTIPMYTQDGAMQEEGATAVHEVLSLSVPEVADADVDLSQTYTNEFVEDDG